MRILIPSFGLAVAALSMSATSAWAGVPFFNATCPGRIEVHADQGGPIYVGGREATLKRFNENYYEARSGEVTISLTIRPDGTPDVSYTGKNRANGVCQVKAAPDDGMKPSDNARSEPRGRRSAGVSMEALPDQCRREATEEFDIRPSDVTTHMAFRSGERIVVQGNFPDGGHTTFFNCWFDGDGKFVLVN